MAMVVVVLVVVVPGVAAVTEECPLCSGSGSHSPQSHPRQSFITGEQQLHWPLSQEWNGRTTSRHTLV